LDLKRSSRVEIALLKTVMKQIVSLLGGAAKQARPTLARNVLHACGFRHASGCDRSR
jgi:hypothetical protein